jgi:hypothetical protein
MICCRKNSRARNIITKAENLSSLRKNWLPLAAVLVLIAGLHSFLTIIPYIRYQGYQNTVIVLPLFLASHTTALPFYILLFSVTVFGVAFIKALIDGSKFSGFAILGSAILTLVYLFLLQFVLLITVLFIIFLSFLLIKTLHDYQTHRRIGASLLIACFGSTLSFCGIGALLLTFGGIDNRDNVQLGGYQYRLLLGDEAEYMRYYYVLLECDRFGIICQTREVRVVGFEGGDDPQDIQVNLSVDRSTNSILINVNANRTHATYSYTP